MRLFGMLCLLVIVSQTPGSAQPSSHPAVGLWLSEDRSDGGLGSWIELREDGTASVSVGALVEGTYKMTGSSLRLFLSPGKNTEAPNPDPPAMEMRITGNVATRIQPPPADLPPRASLTPEDKAMLDRMTRPVEMTRLSAPPPNAPPIVGMWKYTHYTGATAYELYTKSGAMVLLVSMQVQEGKHSTSANSVTLHLPNGTAPIVVKGDVLTITFPDGQRSVLRRAPR